MLCSTRRVSPYLSKLESIASSAVRVADKVRAKLIVVYTQTGLTAHLVAKYRPPMPILTLVVPQLKSDGLRWQLEGRQVARQCMLTRGLLPMLAAPSNNADNLLDQAVRTAASRGLVRAHDHVVCVQRVKDDFCVKIVSVDTSGLGISRQDKKPSGHLSSEMNYIGSTVDFAAMNTSPLGPSAQALKLSAAAGGAHAQGAHPATVGRTTPGQTASPFANK